MSIPFPSSDYPQLKSEIYEASDVSSRVRYCLVQCHELWTAMSPAEVLNLDSLPLGISTRKLTLTDSIQPLIYSKNTA
jgi:hypothetical protein